MAATAIITVMVTSPTGALVLIRRLRAVDVIQQYSDGGCVQFSLIDVVTFLMPDIIVSNGRKNAIRHSSTVHLADA